MKYALLSVLLLLAVCAGSYVFFHSYMPLERVETTACQSSLRRYYFFKGEKDEFDTARKADPSFGSNYDSTCEEGNMDTIELYL